MKGYYTVLMNQIDWILDRNPNHKILKNARKTKRKMMKLSVIYSHFAEYESDDGSLIKWTDKTLKYPVTLIYFDTGSRTFKGIFLKTDEDFYKFKNYQIRP